MVETNKRFCHFNLISLLLLGKVLCKRADASVPEPQESGDNPEQTYDLNNLNTNYTELNVADNKKGVYAELSNTGKLSESDYENLNAKDVNRDTSLGLT